MELARNHRTRWSPLERLQRRMGKVKCEPARLRNDFPVGPPQPPIHIYIYIYIYIHIYIYRRHDSGRPLEPADPKTTSGYAKIGMDMRGARDRPPPEDAIYHLIHWVIGTGGTQYTVWAPGPGALGPGSPGRPQGAGPPARIPAPPGPRSTTRQGPNTIFVWMWCHYVTLAIKQHIPQDTARIVDV